MRKDKPFIDYIRKDENLKKSYQELAKELNTSVNNIRRIHWDYRDAIENDVFYRLDILRVLGE